MIILENKSYIFSKAFNKIIGWHAYAKFKTFIYFFKIYEILSAICQNTVIYNFDKVQFMQCDTSLLYIVRHT